MHLRHLALVVDDSRDVCDEVTETLRSVGHECVCVGSQEEAEAELTTRSFCYVLLDLQLPVKKNSLRKSVETGFNLLTRIRERFSEEELPVVVMTAHGTEHHECLRAMKLKATDYVKKPFPENGLESLEAKARAAARTCESSNQQCPNVPCQPERRSESSRRRVATSGLEPPVGISKINVRGPQGTVIGSAGVVVMMGSDGEGRTSLSDTGDGGAASGAAGDEISDRVEKLERRMASRLDLSQFGYLTIRQITMLAGQDHDKTRKSWAKKCESCAVSERGKRRARLHDPWKVAAVMEAERVVPRWGVLALQHCHEAVTETRKLSKQQSDSLEGLLGRWFGEYTVPAEFRGARGDSDRDEIKAQMAFNLARYAGEGEGGLAQDEFDRALARAEASALEWWKQDVLRSRNRENPLQARDGDGEDVTGRLDAFEAPGVDDS